MGRRVRGTRIADGATRLGTIVERLLTTAKVSISTRPNPDPNSPTLSLSPNPNPNSLTLTVTLTLSRTPSAYGTTTR